MCFNNLIIFIKRKKRIISCLNIAMGSIEPKFEVDEKGRTICKEHNRYFHFIREDKDYFQDLYLDIELTCKSCYNYENNECYFSKSRIDEIESNRIKKKKGILCKLCGKKIDRMFTVIHKIYYEENYEVEMPLICCDCFEKIDNKEFMSYTKKIFDFYLINIVVSLFFFFYFTFFLAFLNVQTIFYFTIVIPILIIISLIIFIIIVKCIKKLIYLTFGKKYYKKFYFDESINSED